MSLWELGDISIEVLVASSIDSEEDTPSLWGFVGTPIHIYLSDGTPRWIDIGFREDLVELVHIVAAAAP